MDQTKYDQKLEEFVTIVLAAGQGSRMNSDLPKVLHSLGGKPLLQHVIDNLIKADCKRIIVVVGYKGEMVMEQIGSEVEYVWQKEQLGTGHAVLQAEESLSSFQGKIIITCGDVPLIKPETYLLLLKESEAEKVKAVVLTMKQENPTGYGRILKDDQGDFLRIVEEKDASEQEKLIKEVNAGVYLFDKELLFKGLKKVDCDNAQNEFYLPDALQSVLKFGWRIKTLPLSQSLEGKGINAKEDLLELENYYKEQFAK